MNQNTKMKYKWFMKIGDVFLIILNRRISDNTAYQAT